MAQHTPGPWIVNGNTIEHETEILNRDGIPLTAVLAEIYSSFDNNLPREENEANSLLMAASPDLLQAAVKIAAIWQPGKYSQKKMDAAVDELRAAISKATE
jgi:ribose 5-phosphate isomerase RpiB